MVTRVRTILKTFRIPKTPIHIVLGAAFNPRCLWGEDLYAPRTILGVDVEVIPKEKTLDTKETLLKQGSVEVYIPYVMLAVNVYLYNKRSR